MSSRKIKIDNSLTIEIPEGGEFIFTDDGKVVKKGTIDPFTGEPYVITDDTILIAGSKSSLKRMNLIERNVLVLAKKQSAIESKLDKIINLLEGKK